MSRIAESHYHQQPARHVGAYCQLVAQRRRPRGHHLSSEVSDATRYRSSSTALKRARGRISDGRCEPSGECYEAHLRAGRRKYFGQGPRRGELSLRGAPLTGRGLDN